MMTTTFQSPRQVWVLMMRFVHWLVISTMLTLPVLGYLWATDSGASESVSLLELVARHGFPALAMAGTVWAYSLSTSQSLTRLSLHTLVTLPWLVFWLYEVTRLELLSYLTGG
jgi:cytochrome b561